MSQRGGLTRIPKEGGAPDTVVGGEGPPRRTIEWVCLQHRGGGPIPGGRRGTAGLYPF